MVTFFNDKDQILKHEILKSPKNDNRYCCVTHLVCVKCLLNIYDSEKKVSENLSNCHDLETTEKSSPPPPSIVGINKNDRQKCQIP